MIDIIATIGPATASLQTIWELLQAGATIFRINGAHGDYEDLCQFLSCQNPELVRKLFLVHGENDVQIDFAARLRRKHFKEVIIPDMHEMHLLD